MANFEIAGKLWRWEMATKNGVWIFLTVTGPVVDEIRVAAMAGPWLLKRAGFGSVKVQAELGESCWLTSLFPYRGGEGWILPVKAAVRRAERVGEGDEVRVTIRLWEG